MNQRIKKLARAFARAQGEVVSPYFPVKKVERLSTQVSTLVQSIKNSKYLTREDLQEIVASLKNLELESKNKDQVIKDLKGEISKRTNKSLEELRTDLLSRIGSIGGGNMNRQILVDGVDVLTRYTDINWISGSGVTLSAVKDDTNKRTKITVSGNASSWSTPIESPDGTITQFTVGATIPTDVIADGTAYFSGAGYTYSSPYITFDSPPRSASLGGYVRFR